MRFKVAALAYSSIQNWKPEYWQKLSVTLLILISISVALMVGWLITKKWGIAVQETQNSIDTTRSRMILSGFVLLAFLLVVGAGWLVYGMMPEGSLPDQPEIQMGLIIVTAIAALMTLLFIMAVGFSFVNLTDPKQPLGLPEGSIRAMIALILIMVFIIFGIYLFRVVGSGFYAKLETDVTAIDPTKFAGQTTYVESVKDKDGRMVLDASGRPLYNVWLQTKTSDDGARLAQQLLTTVGTLVVAVAGFYFGSTAVSSAVAAAQGTTAASPSIKDVKPREGAQGAEISLEISGTDFKSPKTVRLVRGSEVMIGSEILSSPTKILCRVTIDKDPDGKWDVVVENEDGKLARLPEAFTIVKSS